MASLGGVQSIVPLHHNFSLFGSHSQYFFDEIWHFALETLILITEAWKHQWHFWQNWPKSNELQNFEKSSFSSKDELEILCLNSEEKKFLKI